MGLLEKGNPNEDLKPLGGSGGIFGAPGLCPDEDLGFLGALRKKIWGSGWCVRRKIWGCGERRSGRRYGTPGRDPDEDAGLLGVRGDPCEDLIWGPRGGSGR